MYRLRLILPHVTVIAMAVASGVSLLLAHAPYNVWPASFLAPALLVAAVWHTAATRSKPTVPAALVGLIAGASFFGPLLSWLILPAGLVGWLLLAFTQTVYVALLAVIIHATRKARFAALAVGTAWTSIDVIRGVFPLGGFEWGAIAYAHVDGSWLLPVARIGGAHAITLLVVTLSVAALQIVIDTKTVAHKRHDQQLGATLSIRHVPTATLLGGLFLSVLLTIEPPAAHGTLDVLAVQGNDVKHWEENRPRGDAPLRIVNALADQTLASVVAAGPPDVTFWPESAIDRDPFSARGQSLLPAIRASTAVTSPLIAGITLDGPDPQTQRFVAAAVFDDSASIVGQYTKRRLVPFGEYIPLRRFLDWFPPLQQTPRDAIAGSTPQQIVLADGTRIAVAICFETMFSSTIHSNITAGDEDAGLIVVLTNNASFGVSAAPYQHLAQSQLRAVETGRWVVHAAISGASAIIDPHGRIHQQTGLFTLETLRADVPLVDGRTPFLATGDIVGFLSVFSLLIMGGTQAFKRVRRRASR
ncbi:MAG: apolipoprotein N-acyltransferase [Nitriliruptoraceae bacterium]